MKVRLKTLLCFAVLCSLLGASARAADRDAAVRSSLQHDLAQYLSARGGPEHVSAASLSVSLHGAPSNIDVTAGTMKFGSGAAFGPRALFQIGSNTKAFTAVALLQLEAQGKLNIDQTLGRWLPQYPAWKSVTIRRLLNMTSGIPSYTNQPTMMKSWAASPQKVLSEEQLVAYVYPRNGRGPKPTTGWSYSNTNYILAQMIVERATGHRYADEIRHRFLDDPKLALHDTYYSSTVYPPAVLDRMVSGYFYNNDADNADLAPLFGKDVSRLNLSWAQGAGGILSIPEDVTRWSRALYVGELLQPAQRRELMTIVSDATGKPIATTTLKSPRGFGLGVGQMTLPGMGTFWYYQGETLGYRMVYAWLPKSDAVFAVGVNSQPPGKQNHIGQLLQSIYGTLHAAGKV